MAKKCKVHPTYKGIRKPRARDKVTNELCAACVEIYNETQASGIKERRNRKPRAKAKAKVVIAVKKTDEELPGVDVDLEDIAATAIAAQAENQVSPAVEEQDKCEPCIDDEILDELEDDVLSDLDDEDWDMDDDDDEELELDDEDE